jgi:purine-nucleoside phosphorylase
VSAPPPHIDARVREVVDAIRTRTDHVPRVALTLGSGLGGVVDALEAPVAFPTTTLPHWPASTVPGHAGRLALGQWCGVPVVALAGRSHRYEGYALDRVTLAVRVMHALGARTMVFTNAVGATNPGYAPGDLMLATDHLNMIGRHGLFTRDELAARRMGRTVAALYAPELCARLRQAALEAHVPMHEGVLVGGQGPSYETAAEVRAAFAAGGDVACMSTVHEVTVGAQLGCEVASISCITNRATGLSDRPLTHEEVTEVADRAALRLRAVLEQFLVAEARAA